MFTTFKLQRIRQRLKKTMKKELPFGKFALVLFAVFVLNALRVFGTDSEPGRIKDPGIAGSGASGTVQVGMYNYTPPDQTYSENPLIAE